MIDRSMTVLHIEGKPELRAHVVGAGVALVVHDDRDGPLRFGDAMFWMNEKYRDRLPAAVDAFNAALTGDEIAGSS